LEEEERNDRSGSISILANARQICRGLAVIPVEPPFFGAASAIAATQ
jgi:hypothetical protein